MSTTEVKGIQRDDTVHDETYFTAADMATAAAQGFRDGQAAQAAVAAGWVKAKDQSPPCRDDKEYIGINTAGFAGVFNAVRVSGGNTYCLMETAEESVSIMSDLDIWKPFIRPAPSTEGESN